MHLYISFISCDKIFLCFYNRSAGRRRLDYPDLEEMVKNITDIRPKIPN
jgi:hypothetical protein